MDLKYKIKIKKKPISLLTEYYIIGIDIEDFMMAVYPESKLFENVWSVVNIVGSFFFLLLHLYFQQLYSEIKEVQ